MSMMGQNPLEGWRRRSAPVMDYQSAAGSPAIATFFNAVYGWMAAGLALTGVVAGLVYNDQTLMRQVFNGPALLILFVAEIALVWTIAAAVHRLSATAATVLFLLYAAINGLTLSGIFVVYAIADIAVAFVITAAMFGAMSLYGMVTRTDLSRLGSILFMALIGLIIATIVNIFLRSPGLEFLLSYLGVAIFCGLTAWDTQRLRYIAVSTSGDAAMASRLAISGALALYLDFINLFLFLVQILGNSRRR